MKPYNHLSNALNYFNSDILRFSTIWKAYFAIYVFDCNYFLLIIFINSFSTYLHCCELSFIPYLPLFFNKLYLPYTLYHCLSSGTWIFN